MSIGHFDYSVYRFPVSWSYDNVKYRGSNFANADRKLQFHKKVEFTKIQ
jgi:phosphatidylserine decarboxylase